MGHETLKSYFSPSTSWLQGAAKLNKEMAAKVITGIFTCCLLLYVYTQIQTETERGVIHENGIWMKELQGICFSIVSSKILNSSKKQVSPVLLLDTSRNVD